MSAAMKKNKKTTTIQKVCGPNSFWPCLHGGEGQYHCRRIARIKEITRTIFGPHA